MRRSRGVDTIGTSTVSCVLGGSQRSWDTRRDRRGADFTIWGLGDDTHRVSASRRNNGKREASDPKDLGRNQLFTLLLSFSASSLLLSSSFSSSSSMKWLCSNVGCSGDGTGRSDQTPSPSLTGLGATRRGTARATGAGFCGCGGCVGCVGRSGSGLVSYFLSLPRP